MSCHSITTEFGGSSRKLTRKELFASTACASFIAPTEIEVSASVNAAGSNSPIIGDCAESIIKIPVKEPVARWGSVKLPQQPA